MTILVALLIVLAFLAMNKHPKAAVALSAIAVIAETVNLIV